MIECYFQGQAVGYLSEIPQASGVFCYEPCRGMGHREFAKQLKTAGTATGYCYTNGQKHIFTVTLDDANTLQLVDWVSETLTAKTQTFRLLANLSPTELVKRLTHLAQRHPNALLRPIWLNNDGQNVIGLIPKALFVCQLNAKTAYLESIESYRQTIATDSTTYETRVIDAITFDDWQQRLIAYQQQQPAYGFEHRQQQTGYQNGFIGFISYDMSAVTLTHRQLDPNDLAKHQPLAYMGHYDIYLTQVDNHWQLNATTSQAIAQLDIVQYWLAQVAQLANPLASLPKLTFTPMWTQADYAAAFDQVQDYLTAGDCYQINLTQCWQGKLSQHQLVDYLPQLHQATYAPFAGYLILPNYELLSCSPELFFTFAKTPQGEITVTTKPIKGTIPRGASDKQDIANQTQLANSDKDKAENVMIVDLLRNDLGKYAKTGSVNVPKLCAIESFSNVHHLVSTITATLKNDIHPLTVLFDSLPAGSITGCPKKRAVEIIHELEAQPRGAYCGSLGYLNFDGTGQWNVLIRTLQAVGDDVTLWAGGGITIASKCDAEYQECWDKVGNLLNVLAQNT